MSLYNCDGKGRCLLEDQDNKKIFTKNRNFNCKYKCVTFPCANYVVCENLAPKYILRSNKGLCEHCLYCFGHLVFSAEDECPLCFETKVFVKEKNCDHTVCIDCFKRCKSPPYWNDPKPVFPYSSKVREKYEYTYDLPKWLNDPLIVKYKEDTEKWYLERKLRYEEEAYLRACPFCRKE